MPMRERWNSTGKARGTSIKIPSYAKASEGYPPSAKSAEAVIYKPMTIFGKYTHSSIPLSGVVFCVGG